MLKNQANQSRRTPQRNEPLEQFIKNVSPDLKPMPHLRPLFDALDQTDTKPARLLVSVPPQHSKSTAGFHWLVKNVINGNDCIYATYSHEFATYQMRRAKAIAERAGIRLRSDSRALCEWYTVDGAALTAVGLGGALTGKPAKRILVDDPFKGFAEASSGVVRDSVDEWFRGSVLTRAHPDSSVVIIHTRWHPDDIIGRLSSESGWDYINLRAIDYDGNALWPEERPIEFLEQQRREMGAFAFASLYQGEPRPRGGRVFNGAHYYAERPNEYKAAIGLDLAYTAKTSADYSVSVVMAKAGDKFYVLDMQRKQVSAPEFALTIRNQVQQYRGAQVLWYYAGAEKSAIDFMNERGIPVRGEPAIIDKLARAQKFAAAWNEGRVLIPEKAEWTRQFLAELLDFTGLQDAHDDIVDACAAAYNALHTSVTVKAAMSSSQRTTSSLKGYY